VYYHNAKRHLPISLEVVWATKIWANRVFAFLLAITEVNCMLGFQYFYKEKCDGMLAFWKMLAKELINNTNLQEEESKATKEPQKCTGRGAWCVSPASVKEVFGCRGGRCSKQKCSMAMHFMQEKDTGLLQVYHGNVPMCQLHHESHL
jgi:hypothetical protein